MRVLFDHQIFSYQSHGGISRYFAELLRWLPMQRGVEVELALRHTANEHLAGMPGRPSRDVLPFLDGASRLRLLARYVPNRRFSNARIRRGAYDVFHPTFFDPAFLRPLDGRPFVLTLHDLTPVVFPELFPRRGLYGRLVTGRWIESMGVLAAKAARIIAISASTKADAVRHFGLDAAKITVIHLGISLNPDLSADLPGVDLSRPYLLFVGGRSGYKNFAAFTRAVAPLLQSHRELGVVCVGGGPFCADERSLLLQTGCGDRFAQVGATDAQLATLYRHARALVFPSRYEGFGLPIVEAFSCGCPCVVSAASSFPEIAGDAAVYFDPDDVGSMGGAIATVLGDPSLRESLIARGAVRANLFSWEETARRTLAVYREACDCREDAQ